MGKIFRRSIDLDTGTYGKVDRHSAIFGLDIGCGENKRSGMIGLDLRRTASVDIIADACMLPFRDESFDHVFSSHLIEHFCHRWIDKVITEWVRVLKRGGTVEVRCPDLRARALLFFLDPSWRNMRNIYGEQNYAGNYHKCGFSFGLLKSSLRSCGIKKVRRISKGYKGIPFIPDCLHVKGIKG